MKELGWYAGILAVVVITAPLLREWSWAVVAALMVVGIICDVKERELLDEAERLNLVAQEKIAETKVKLTEVMEKIKQ
jgi:hypothetical protein